PFPNWGWLLASGIVTILIAFYLWASLPVTAVWLLGVLLGIQLICEGAALGYLAWQVRAAEKLFRRQLVSFLDEIRARVSRQAAPTLVLMFRDACALKAAGTGPAAG